MHASALRQNYNIVTYKRIAIWPPAMQYFYKKKFLVPLFRYSIFRVLVFSLCTYLVIIQTISNQFS